MSRKTYIWDKEQQKLVEKTKAQPAQAHYIIPDIQEYRVVGPEYGKVITSRSRHREYLKRHQLVEVGDQKPKWLK